MTPKLNPELEEKIKECYGYTNEGISEKLQQISDKLDEYNKYKVIFDYCIDPDVLVEKVHRLEKENEKAVNELYGENKK